MRDFVRVSVWVFVLLFGGVAVGQESPPKPDVVQEMKANPFRRELLRAITQGVANKEITRVQAMQLRAGCFSPAFLAMAEKVAVTQMAFSGEDVPTNDEGKVEVRDWAAFLDFLVKLLPILLDLLDRFTFNGGGEYHAYA